MISRKLLALSSWWWGSHSIIETRRCCGIKALWIVGCCMTRRRRTISLRDEADRPWSAGIRPVEWSVVGTRLCMCQVGCAAGASASVQQQRWKAATGHIMRSGTHTEAATEIRSSLRPTQYAYMRTARSLVSIHKHALQSSRITTQLRPWPGRTWFYVNKTLRKYFTL